jgi:Na+/H+ antiporter NhaD/arsenite permease-like protein
MGADPDVWQPIVVLLVLTSMLLAMFFEVWTPTLVMIFALLIVWNCGIINTEDALSGFSNSGMITVGCLFVIVQGVEKSHVFEIVANKVFGQDTSKWMAMLRLMLMSFLFSSIFNNTPIVAILLPITRDWARSRGFAPSEFLIPLSFSSILGGVLTMIGTSTNLVIAGLLDDSDRVGFNFIDPAL